MKKCRRHKSKENLPYHRGVVGVTLGWGVLRNKRRCPGPRGPVRVRLCELYRTPRARSASASASPKQEGRGVRPRTSLTLPSTSEGNPGPKPRRRAPCGARGGPAEGEGVNRKPSLHRLVAHSTASDRSSERVASTRTGGQAAPTASTLQSLPALPLRPAGFPASGWAEGHTHTTLAEEQQHINASA
eukprot:gene11893-biopygen1868